MNLMKANNLANTLSTCNCVSLEARALEDGKHAGFCSYHSRMLAYQWLEKMMYVARFKDNLRKRTFGLQG